MSWLFGWGGGGEGTGGGAGHSSSSHSHSRSGSKGDGGVPTLRRIKTGEYDLRVPPTPSSATIEQDNRLLMGGTPQQHALVQLKRAVQVRSI